MMVKRKAPSQPAADEPVGTAHDTQPAKLAKLGDAPVWKNKEKVLLLSSRGITHRYSPSSHHLRLLGIHCTRQSEILDALKDSRP